MYLIDKNFGEPQLRCLEVGTVEHFADWLGRHPADKEYNYRNCRGECLLSQYSTEFFGSYAYPNYLPSDWDDIAFQKPWTFGAALSRARALQSKAV